MPYASVSDLPPAVKKLPENKQKQFMHVWNSAYDRCQVDGGSDCEAFAFKNAWGVVRKSYEYVEGYILEGENLEGDDFIVALEKSSAAINDLPDSAFAYIESGGKKDESGKTVPRSLRHFPIHDATHVRNALARMNQSPFGKYARAKIIAAAGRMGIKLDKEKWQKSAFTVKLGEFFQKMADLFVPEYDVENFGDIEPKIEPKIAQDPPKNDQTCKTCKKPMKECVCKSDTTKFEHIFELKKANWGKNLVYGIVYAPNDKDTHGDFTSPEEIECAAHGFLPAALKNGPAEWTDVNHKDPVTDVEVVESYIAPVDFKIGEELVSKGSWVVVSRVNNAELRASIEKGEITGYSLEGRAKKVEIELT